MQSTLEKDDKLAGLNDVAAVLDHDPSRVMLEPPDLHSDPVERAMSLAAQLPPPDPALRAAPPVNDNVAPPTQGRQGSFARVAARGLLAVAVGAAATVGWLSYGEAARQMLATWAPQFAVPAQHVKVAEQTPAPAETAAPQPTPPVAAAAVAPPPAAETPAAPPVAQAEPVLAAAAPDLTPRVEEMAREIASLRETIEQLKTSQQQLSRELAKAVERKTATTTPPTSPKPVTAAVRNPPSQQPAYTPPQPAYSPPPPQQRQVYAPPRDYVYSPRDPVYSREVYAEPPRVYTPPPPQVYAPPPSAYDVGAPRPPRPLP